jgi:hypothetical protein
MMIISSEDSPPSPRRVDEKFKHILLHKLELFGIMPKVGMPESTIIKDETHCKTLHDWLKENGSAGELILLH